MTSAVPAPHAHHRGDREVIPAGVARRMVLAAQGFVPRTARPVSARRLEAVAVRMGVVQLDSVNVVVRSHYLPFFSRLGAYPRDVLDRLCRAPGMRLAEYWVHEASLIPVASYPLLRWRMSRAAHDAWGGMQAVAQDSPALLRAVRDAVTDLGPSTAAQVEAALDVARGAPRQAWGWNWSDVKRALEYLFWAGELTSAGRSMQFERRYDLPERVLPATVLAAEPEPSHAHRELVAAAALAFGVAEASSLRDYHRLRLRDAIPAIDALVEDGVLRPVLLAPHPRTAAEGAKPRPGYVHRLATVPTRLRRRALLSPFDPLIWHRRRTEHLFGMRYRLQLYTPAAQRTQGYYVLPFLLGDSLVARVDVKAERSGGGVLRIRGAWAEPEVGARRGLDVDVVASELADEVRLMAAWLGLADVDVDPVGGLAGELAAAVAR